MSPACLRPSPVLVATLCLVASACVRPGPDRSISPAAPPDRSYLCLRASAPIRVDGRLEEQEWAAAPWSEPFVDIEGQNRPPPELSTRMRMLWDDGFLYIAAEMEEPHLWGTLTERDAVIYRDDDFEVFLDPDGDTHDYYELEINVLGTVWDLMLTRPYRDAGRAIDSWDMRGMRTAVVPTGTVNDPADLDRGWAIEIALPWEAITEAAPEGRRPLPGEYWRINFSRVDWVMDIQAGGYVKRADPATGRALPERNWVWAPQGAVNMHMPERWGFIWFDERSELPLDEAVKWALRQVYYAQREHHRIHGAWASSTEVLGLTAMEVPGHTIRPEIATTPALWEAWATVPGTDRVWHIGRYGRVWREEPR